MTIASMKSVSASFRRLLRARRPIIVLGVGVLGIGIWPSATQSATLSDNQIETLLKGNTAHVLSPKGAQSKMYFRDDGQSFMKCCAPDWKHQDTGTWWVQGSKLCLQWKARKNRRKICRKVVSDKDVIMLRGEDQKLEIVRVLTGNSENFR